VSQGPLNCDYLQFRTRNALETGTRMTAPAPRSGRARLFAALSDYLGMVGVLGLLILFFGLKTDHFLEAGTFRTIANQIPYAVLIAVGMTYVLIIAGIDLSVGSVLALSSAVMGVCMVKAGLPMPVAALAAMGTGLLCGLANGLVTIAWGLPSFIVTLGMLEAARGGTFLVSSSETLYIGGKAAAIATWSVVGLSLPFLIAVAVVVAGQLVLTRTVFGRYLVAIGTNEEAVRLSGIDPRPIKLAVFGLCGLLSGVAAILQTSRMESADPNMGVGDELSAIAAVVIGGTSLMGGRGSVVNSFFGVVIIAVLGTGLNQMGAGDPTKRLITGCVIVAAAVLDHYRQRLWKGR
jgi:ribose transport system permease protein